MSVIHNEDFEGSLSAWTLDPRLTATTSAGAGISPTSPTHVLQLSIGGNADHYAVYNTTDGNGGDCQVQCNFNAPAAGNTMAWGLILRADSTSAGPSSGTYYLVYFDVYDWQFLIYKVVGGVHSQIGATINIAGVTLPVWYQGKASISGSGPVSLACSIQRLSDGYWLDPTGNWQSSQQTLYYTDSSSPITGAGYAGLTMSGRSNAPVADDWIFSTYAPVTVTLYAADGPLAAESSWRSPLSGDSGHPAETGLEWQSIADAGSSGDSSLLAWFAGDSGSGISNGVATTFAGGFIYSADGGTAGDAASITVGLAGDLSTDAEAFESTLSILAADGGFADDSAELSRLASVVSYAAIDPIFGTESAPAPTAFALDLDSRTDELGSAALLGGDGASASGALDSGTASEAWYAVVTLVGLESGFGTFDQGYGEEAWRSHVVFTSSGYLIYENDGHGGPINYAAPVHEIDDFDTTTWTTPTLAAGTWSFAVRAFNPNGEEQNIDVAVTFVIDASGHDITDIPDPPVALAAVAIGGGKIRVEWAYPTGLKASFPTGFHVYQGTGAVSYSSPVATVSAAWTGLMGRYSATITGLTHGTTYRFGVRAYNASGEESNTATVSAVARSIGPNAPVSLAISAIS